MYTDHGYCGCPCHADNDEQMTEDKWNRLRESASKFGRVMPSYRAHVAAEEWARRMEYIIKRRIRGDG